MSKYRKYKSNNGIVVSKDFFEYINNGFYLELITYLLSRRKNNFSCFNNEYADVTNEYILLIFLEDDLNFLYLQKRIL